MNLRHLLVGCVLATGACTTGAPPLATSMATSMAAPVETACSTATAKVSFDFEGASFSRCVIEGEREFSVMIAPEHEQPINPSPWYAFRYDAQGGGDVIVHLRYLVGEHRYAPNWDDGKSARQLDAATSADRKTATLVLPAGQATVSAQEIFGTGRYRKALARWAKGRHAQSLILGRSHGRREIGAVRIGRPDAPRLVVLIGRQHPPEVTGAIAMEAFVDRIAEMAAADAALTARYQFLIVPMVNPDGVAHGNWRANLGGKDLNRDWGEFSQPETQAVRAWLAALPEGVRPVLMLDFHSTFRNLFYVQGDEASEQQERFLAAWLGGKETAFANYPFSLERRNANPGSGTTKNWFHENFGIPAYTYEAADDADRTGIRNAARALATDLPGALQALEE